MERLKRTGQETARKYTKPSYNKNYPRGEPRLDEKVMQRDKRDGNWRQVAYDRDGWMRETGEANIEEEKENYDVTGM
jgi:hypothetical protein